MNRNFHKPCDDENEGRMNESGVDNAGNGMNESGDGMDASGDGMDDLLKDVFRDDAVPPEAEERLRGRMAEFRHRLDAREERDRRRPWWAALFSPAAASRLVVFGSVACGALVLVFVLTAPQTQSLLDPNRGKVNRVRDDTRVLTVAMEAYPVSTDLAPTHRGDASGILSGIGNSLASSAGKANPAAVTDFDGDGDRDLFVTNSSLATAGSGFYMGTYDDTGATIRSAIPTPLASDSPAGPNTFRYRGNLKLQDYSVQDSTALNKAVASSAGSYEWATEIDSAINNQSAGALNFNNLRLFPTLSESSDIPKGTTTLHYDGGLTFKSLGDSMPPGSPSDTLYQAWAVKDASLAKAPLTAGYGYHYIPNYSVGDLNGDGVLEGIGYYGDVAAATPAPPPAPEPPSALSDYDRIVENAFLPTLGNPLSTFSIDVDTASYSNMRRLLMARQLPPADAVRIEEMINYFPYDYPQPTGDAPFSVTTEIASCPWSPEHRLLRIGLKGYEIPADQRPPSNLVFLIDVSGSMDTPEKLPLLKEGFKVFVDHLSDSDRVAIAVYAGASGLVLPSTPATERQTILDALDRLQAGGSTNGGEGIQLAYDIAAKHFIKDGVNRVILATDGDFNVGVTDRAELVRLIEAKAKTGVFLSVLGYGICGCKDSVMEELSNKGNGNYAYIDDALEARRVLVDQMSATLVTIAKDVKIQVEFNPGEIAAYRLIGYENRMLAKEDFNDDTKDAGEIGAGHTVTALYELVPAGANAKPETSDGSDRSAESAAASAENPTAADLPAAAAPAPAVDALKYQEPVRLSAAAETGEALTVKLRYKKPDGDTSRLIEQSVHDTGAALDAASPDLKFAAAVAGFGLLLRKSEYKGTATYQSIHDLAREGVGADPYTYRSEFVDLIELAASLAGAPIGAAKE